MKHAIVGKTKIRLYEKNNPCEPAYATRILRTGVYDCIDLNNQRVMTYGSLPVFDPAICGRLSLQSILQ